MSEIEGVAVDPETGEVLALDELRERLNRLDAEMVPLYRYRSWLREQVAELSDPAAIPRPRERTRKQEAVTHCPRCGTRLQTDTLRPDEGVGSASANQEGP